MLRRRYHKKKEAARKAEGRQEENASVRNSTGPQRGIYRCAENGLLIPFGSEDPFPFSPAECLCFSGHRSLSGSESVRLQKKLLPALKAYYSQGKTVFISGAALGFDTLAAQSVLLLKKDHYPVRLVLAVPCRSQASRWSSSDQRVYHKLMQAADDVVFVSQDYFPGCMQKRNRFLVDHADTCLCYMTKCRGGTWYTVSYAYETQRKIHNLALEI